MVDMMLGYSDLSEHPRFCLRHLQTRIIISPIGKATLISFFDIGGENDYF